MHFKNKSRMISAIQSVIYSCNLTSQSIALSDLGLLSTKTYQVFTPCEHWSVNIMIYSTGQLITINE